MKSSACNINSAKQAGQAFPGGDKQASFSFVDVQDSAGIVEDAQRLQFIGNWTCDSIMPTKEAVLAQLKTHMHSGRNLKVLLNFESLKGWDGALFSRLFGLIQALTSQNIEVAYEGAPLGLQKLLKLALAVPTRKKEAQKEKLTLITRLGISAMDVGTKILSVLSFIGENALAFFNFLCGRARYRKGDLLEIVGESGPYALPIVTLISMLVGVIFAFIGAIQLRQFGAQIYVANLVGIGMTREMGAIMVGIIMAGRTGAAFAAQLGTMQVNEEIDALKTMGISPMEFLVLPRMLALIVMMPFLCVYADIGGMLGGAIVSAGALDISFWQFFEQLRRAVSLGDIAIGVAKSVVFGVMIALAGCFQGIMCGRSASSVGLATTTAVVSSIVCLVIGDAVFAVVCNIIGI